MNLNVSIINWYEFEPQLIIIYSKRKKGIKIDGRKN